ncbi:hypothetical protein ACWGE1_20695 [Streptomyces sp. NPDC054932]
MEQPQVTVADGAVVIVCAGEFDLDTACVLAGPLPTRLRRLLEMTGALELFEVRDNTTDPAA